MAAPKFTPVSPVADPRGYESPPYVPTSWMPDRPAEIVGSQPRAPHLGFQGPDQGFAVKIARMFEDRVHLQPGERFDAAMNGCLGIALRRASMFSRAPVVHDLTIAYTIWGWLDTSPPQDLLDERAQVFDGLEHAGHHYSQSRSLVDRVPDETLRMTPAQVQAAYPQRWRDLVGEDA